MSAIFHLSLTFFVENRNFYLFKDCTFEEGSRMGPIFVRKITSFFINRALEEGRRIDSISVEKIPFYLLID